MNNDVFSNTDVTYVHRIVVGLLHLEYWRTLGGYAVHRLSCRFLQEASMDKVG